MINFKKLKLKNQLLVLIAIAMFLMILLQAFNYYKFYTLSEEKANFYSENMVEQIYKELNSMVVDIQNAAYIISYSSITQEYLYSKNVERRLELNVSVSNILNYIKSTNRNISDIKLLSGPEYSEIYSPTISNYSVMKEIENLYNYNDENFKMPIFTHPLFNKDTSKLSYAYISPIYLIINGMGNKVGTSIIVYNINTIQDIVDNIFSTKQSLFAIISKNNTILASNNKKLIGTKLNFSDYGIENKEQLVTDETYSNKNVLVYHKYFESTDWNIVNIIPLGELTSDVKAIRTFGIIIGIIMLLSLLFAGIIITHNVTKPMNDLIAFTKMVGKTNEQKRIYLNYENEVGILAKYINRMLDNIENINGSVLLTQQALYEAELVRNHAKLEQKHAELLSLQSQINPHFLYNTLECIRSYGIANDVIEIEHIVTSLAKMFRYSIKGDDIVFITEEISIIKDYMNIMQIRFGDKFTVDFQINEELMSKRIIKMILQPIVENAIYYGLECIDGPGILVIKGEMDEKGIIIITISDNGIGIEENELVKINSNLDNSINIKDSSKRSIGLINISKRIKLVYGSQYGIEINSTKNIGTTVYIRFPAT